MSSSTLFSSCCGKPLQITKNGEVTTFKYTADGLLKEKVSPREAIQIEYEPRWNKISKVNQNGVVSTYEYDNRGNLTKAFNTKNEKVALSYDKYGRITELTDLAKKKISFKYGPLGKPILIADKNIGSVKISYDPDGRILKTDTELRTSNNRRPTEEESKEVVRKILGGFQNLLDIIRPAGIGLSSET
jgi:YD repeat-containing protein